MDTVLPLLSSVVSFIFGATVFAQYRSRRKMHQLVWSFGLACFGISAFTEFLKGVGVWNVAVYSTWYIFGAFFVAAYLGMGTVYLLAPRRIANGVMGILVALSVVAVVLVLTASIDVTQMVVGDKPSGRGMPNYVRLLTPIFNIFGTVALVGGAAYSALYFWRRRRMAHRALSNLLIAVGALLPAIGSSLLRFEIPVVFYLFEFLGVSIIFLGFLANYEVVASRLTAKAAAKSTI